MNAIISVLVALNLVIIGAALANADQWELPKPHKYYSSNKNYFVEIIPRELESQSKYFDDKARGKAAAGSKKKSDDYCKGTPYRQDQRGNYQTVWSAALSNDVAPVRALVSDDGAYVVIFDNWHFVGFGDDVVVIYDRAGKMIRKLALIDIVPESEVMRMPMSVSSIYWGGEHYLDEKRGHLVLKVASKWSGSPDDLPEYKDIKVDLRTGKVLAGTEARAVSHPRSGVALARRDPALTQLFTATASLSTRLIKRNPTFVLADGATVEGGVMGSKGKFQPFLGKEGPFGEPPSEADTALLAGGHVLRAQGEAVGTLSICIMRKPGFEAFSKGLSPPDHYLDLDDFLRGKEWDALFIGTLHYLLGPYIAQIEPMSYANPTSPWTRR